MCDQALFPIFGGRSWLEKISNKPQVGLHTQNLHFVKAAKLCVICMHHVHRAIVVRIKTAKKNVCQAFQALTKYNASPLQPHTPNTVCTNLGLIKGLPQCSTIFISHKLTPLQLHTIVLQLQDLDEIMQTND